MKERMGWMEGVRREKDRKKLFFLSYFFLGSFLPCLCSLFLVPVKKSVDCSDGGTRTHQSLFHFGSGFPLVSRLVNKDEREFC